MKGRLGIPTALAVVFVLLAVPVAAVESDASAEQPYLSQLDDNGRDIYGELGRLVGNYSNTATVSAALGDPVLFDTRAGAEEYGRAVSADAMAAMYYTDPSIAHLWDLPVKKVDVRVSTEEVTLSARSVDDRYYIATGVEFTLQVPENMRDDENTTQNEFRDRMDELRSVIKEKEFGGDVQYMVRDIAHFLKKTESKEDAEGQVSNIYDALVEKKSSSAGIVSAFTAICTYNGVEAVTVGGTVYSGDEGEPRFWNQIHLDGRWYAGDVVDYNGNSTGFMMAGSASEVTIGGYTSAFSVTHEADLDLADANGLVPPQLTRDGFPYPDETPALIKYGPYVILALIGVILVGTVYHAMKHGNI